MASRRDGGKQGKRFKSAVDENSPVIQVFRSFQRELDARHDKYERIVKLSRDITVESKRVIFLLQRFIGTEDKEALLAQALSKLKDIQQTKFLEIAVELDGEDHYQFTRAYSTGLQEYVEAATFYQYLKSGELLSCSSVAADLQFPRPCTSLQTSTAVSDIPKDPVSTHTVPTDLSDPAHSSFQITSKMGPLVVTVPPMEFMLGVADLTGELMRTAIMSVSEGNLDLPVKICGFMRIIFDAFTSYGNTARELSRKMFTLQQSVQKVENACYTLKVRGSEIPKHMLADVVLCSNNDGQFVEDIEESVYD